MVCLPLKPFCQRQIKLKEQSEEKQDIIYFSDQQEEDPEIESKINLGPHLVKNLITAYKH